MITIKKQPLAVYIQYTNPGIYPPLHHSARVLVNHGWRIAFLGIRGCESNDVLRLPEDLACEVKTIHKWGKGLVLKIHYAVFALWCWWFVRGRRPDLVYISDCLAAPVGLLVGDANTPIIYHEHDSPQEPGHSIVDRIMLYARSAIVKRAKVNIFPNIGRAANLRARSESSRCFVQVMNCPGLDEARQVPKASKRSDGLRVYYHGSIVPDRVPLTIFEAMAQLPLCVELTIVGYETIGNQGYTDLVRRQIKHWDIERRVRIVGPNQRAELFTMCAAHDVGIALIPRKSTDPNFKDMAGASVKIFEYLACSIPVLVSDLPDFNELFVKSGVAKTCRPDEVRTIVDALEWFLENPDERVIMGHRGSERVLRDWNYEYQFEPVMRIIA